MQRPPKDLAKRQNETNGLKADFYGDKRLREKHVSQFIRNFEKYILRFPRNVELKHPVIKWEFF